MPFFLLYQIQRHKKIQRHRTLQNAHSAVEGMPTYILPYGLKNTMGLSYVAGFMGLWNKSGVGDG